MGVAQVHPARGRRGTAEMSPRGKKRRLHRRALGVTLVVLFLIAAQNAFHLWMIEYVEWNVESPSSAYASLLVTFQEDAACELLGSYFVQTIENVEVRGGGTDPWEDSLAFDNTLMEKTFHLLAGQNTTQTILAVEVGLVHWLPNFFVRTVSLNVVGRTESRVSVHIENPVVASAACPYAWNASSAPMNVALTHYLLQTAGQTETKLFSAREAHASEARLSGQTWATGDAWVCATPGADMVPPAEICRVTSDQELFRPAYYIFAVIWAAFALVSFAWYVVFVRAFLLDKVAVVVDDEKPAAPNLGAGAAAVADDAAAAGDDGDDEALMEVKTNFAIAMLRSMLVVDVDLADASVGPRKAAKQYCVLVLPVLLPMLWSIDLACDMNEDTCARKQVIQLPIFYVVAAYTVVVGVFLVGSAWEVYPGNAMRVFLRGLTLALTGVSVLMLCTHLLWLAVALTVDPATAGSRIVGLLSIFIYAQQTWSKLRSTYAKLAARLRKAGHKGADLERELEKRGFSKAQLVSLVWISTAALLLAFVWCVLCGVIFFANRPGTPGGSLLSFLTGAVIPFVAGVMHISSAVKSRSQLQDATPLEDLVTDAAATSETSTLSSALHKVSETLKQIGDSMAGKD